MYVPDLEETGGNSLLNSSSIIKFHNYCYCYALQICEETLTHELYMAIQNFAKSLWRIRMEETKFYQLMCHVKSILNKWNY